VASPNFLPGLILCNQDGRRTSTPEFTTDVSTLAGVYKRSRTVASPNFLPGLILCNQDGRRTSTPEFTTDVSTLVSEVLSTPANLYPRAR